MHDDEHENEYDGWTPPTVEDASTDNVYDDFLRADQPTYDDPDSKLLQPKPRSPRARQYERKTRGLFAFAFKATCGQEATVADSAAILMYGPDLSARVGDLAAENAHVARAVDMLTDGTDNAAAALILTALPFVLQVVRNHEPVVERDNGKRVRTWRIPFTQRAIRFKVGFRLGKRMRNMTNDPDKLSDYVFSNPAVRDALDKQGIKVAKH